ncbi:MAG: response regulator [Planctomycetes bacterium]|nr:response regulator [Planctomycetota bacterium]
MSQQVLIAEDSPTQAQQLQFILEDAGFEVELAENGLEALSVMEQHKPDIVVTDLEMPKMNGLKLVETVKAKYPSIPIILMTAFGSEEIAALALRKGAASYVPKSYLLKDIVPTLQNVLAVSRHVRDNTRVLDVTTAIDSHFLLDNDASIIPPLIGHLEDQLTRMQICDENGLIRVCVALREALINAIDHGNLEVSSELREGDDSKYHDLVNQRRQEAPYKDRRVYFETKISRTAATFVVRDEGKGFDPSSLPDPTDPANLERIGGRGLLLIRTFMDEVQHNNTGTQITMVKKTDPGNGRAEK